MIELILAFTSAGLAAITVWLLLGRTRLVQDAARARASCEAAESSLERESSRAAEVERGLRAQLDEISESYTTARDQLGRLEEQKRLLSEQQEQIQERFRALANETLNSALDGANKRFLELAQAEFKNARTASAAEIDKRRAAVDDLIKPIAETLQKTHTKLEEIEKARLTQFSALGEQISGMRTQSESLREETARLSRALSRPEVRGRYGEIQLRRVAELAGMVDYCDFDEQASADAADGSGRQRPDMVVRLPNDRTIVVDAKCNIQAYIDAASATDDATREEHLQRFARHVSDQAKKLSEKRYWEAIDGSPEFVVMFVPGDQFIDTALSRRPDLMEKAAEDRVILASPSTLIGLLRAVAVGWREHALTEQAAELFVLGKELHERTRRVWVLMKEVGDLLGRTTDKYNALVGSVDSRLTPTLRKFEDAGARSDAALPEIKPIDKPVRALRAAEDGVSD